MPTIAVASRLVYEVAQPTTLLVNVAVATTPRQSIEHERFTVKPNVPQTHLPVGEERNRFVRLSLEPGEVDISYEARVRLEPVTEDAPSVEQTDYESLPPQVMSYLNPSRYCESDRLASYALAEFGAMEANYERVDAICDWIASHIEYRGGTTTALTTACDVLLQRTGVCRDFAHLGITFCRALGIPARYVSGYACHLDPPDFHGFFEAYLTGRWFLFDPTRLAPTSGLVRIGVGRDAADTAFATIWGVAQLKEKTVSAEAVIGSETVGEDNAAEVAVSTA
ncbi:MAG: transglutaminase family protein [Hyphomicrobiaceae bacterium]|nr:transglutaminase family protein [Hyphomicrobiaceae bacterium]